MGTKTQKNMKTLTHLSLFSGIGGLDIAGEMAGFWTVGQCEWGEYPTKVLEKHWPHVPRWRDIHTLTGRDFYEKTGLRTVDVVSGGFPCQPFSVAGQRKGKADDRYLWPEMLRVVSEIRPTWIVCENVAGLTSMAEPDGSPQVAGREIARHAGEDHYRAVLVQHEKMLLEGILQDLEDAGYEVQPFVIPACGVDAPHQRARLCIVAYANRSERRPQCGSCDGLAQPADRLQRQGPKSASGSECGSENVADADSDGGDARRAASAGQQRETGAAYGCHAVADAEGEGIRGVSIQSRQARSSSIDADGGGKNVSNSHQIRCDLRELEGQGIHRAKPSCNEADSSGQAVPYANGAGRKQFHIATQPERARQSAGRIIAGNVDNAVRGGCGGDDRRKQSPQPQNGCGRSAESGLGGMADGLPRWMDEPATIPRIATGIPNRIERLQCLGNAVVPAQFYPFFKYITEIERMWV